jgi:L-amino acid N-acyltransferase YncA
MLSIRPARPDDLGAITEIYNEAILTTNATFDTETQTEDEQRIWFSHHNSKHPIIVAEEGGIIIGWASLSEWSNRCAYADTTENSVYVKKEFWGKGVGRSLLEQLLREGEKAGLHTVIARITEGNEVSIHLHESLGFEHIGIMKEVGKKFGKLLDVYLMQKIYPLNSDKTE